jgi:uncharacterized protein DUF3857/transglutaminase superfamily protein
MQRWIFSVLILCVFSLRAAPAVPVVDDWQPITPEELKMTAGPSTPYDAIILYHQEISNDLKNERSIYMRMKILTEKGKERATVELRYGGLSEGIASFKARTIAPDGTITPFSGKLLNVTIAKGHGIKYFAKTFALPNVQVGSIIEWRYSEYWDRYLYAPHWSIQQDLPQKRAKFVFVPFMRSGHTIVDSHGNSKDRVFTTFIGLPDSTKLKEYPDGSMGLELTDIPAFQEEEFGLPPDTLKMRVNFYYGNNTMTKPESFWKEEGKYWSKEADKFIGHSSAVAAAAAQAVSPSDTEEQKVRKIYAEVQKMKNLSFQFKGELDQFILDQAKNKRTIEDVLREKSGSREELARLFVGMVRSQNIPAYMMIVSDRNKTIFRPTIPNWWQLDSEIAIVTIGGKEIFLDPGTPSCPFELLEWKHTEVQGVRQTASGGTEISETPAPQYRDAYTQRFVRANLDADGVLKGKITLAWLGQEGLQHRLTGVWADEAGRKKDLEDELISILPANAEVKLESVTGWDEPDKPLVAIYDIRIPEFATATGKRLVVPVSIFQLRNKPVLTSAERKTPIYFPYPYQTHDDIKLGLPANVQIETVPDTKPLKPDFAYYQIQRTGAGRVLDIKRDFAIAVIAFPNTDYGKVKQFFDGVNAADAEQVLLTKAAN